METRRRSGRVRTAGRLSDCEELLSLPLRSGGQNGRIAVLHSEAARRASAMDGASAPARRAEGGAFCAVRARSRAPPSALRAAPAARPSGRLRRSLRHPAFAVGTFPASQGKEQPGFAPAHRIFTGTGQNPRRSTGDTCKRFQPRCLSHESAANLSSARHHAVSMLGLDSGRTRETLVAARTLRLLVAIARMRVGAATRVRAPCVTRRRPAVRRPGTCGVVQA
jgi:hypothetical protein